MISNNSYENLTQTNEENIEISFVNRLKHKCLQNKISVSVTTCCVVIFVTVLILAVASHDSNIPPLQKQQKKFIHKTIYFTIHAQSMKEAAQNQIINDTQNWSRAKDAPLSPRGFQQLQSLTENISNQSSNGHWRPLLSKLSLAASTTNYTVGFLSSDSSRAVLTSWNMINAFESVVGQPVMRKLLISSHLSRGGDRSELSNEISVKSEINESLQVTYDYAVKLNYDAQFTQTVQQAEQAFGNFSRFKVLKRHRGRRHVRGKRTIRFLRLLDYQTLVITGHHGWIVNLFQRKSVTRNFTSCPFNFNSTSDLGNTQTIKFDVIINSMDDSVHLENCNITHMGYRS